MRLTASAAQEYHCPRWEELPSIPLYMDQVLFVLEGALSLFAQEEDERVITPTMVNNYVKQKVIDAPEKKRYQRQHLSALMMVSILKTVLSISEIQGVMRLMLDEYDMDAAYNLFCDWLEQELQCAFVLNGAQQTRRQGGKPVEIVLRASIVALTGKLLVRYELHNAPKGTP